MFDNAFEAGETAGANSWETSWGCLLVVSLYSLLLTPEIESNPGTLWCFRLVAAPSLPIGNKLGQQYKFLYV